MAATIQTQNDMAGLAGAQLIPLLNARLADAVDLMTQAKQAHWNVKGPHFAGLHVLFDEVAGALYGYVDTIAERAVQLGGTAEGTAHQAARNSSLDEYPAVVTGRDHCEALSAGLAAFGGRLRQGIAQANTLNDADTADLFTEVSRGVDKWLWFVEAHLQAAD